MMAQGAGAFSTRPRPLQTDAGEYDRWRVEHAFMLVPAQAYVGAHLKTYVEYPPRQKPGSFALDQVLQKLQEGGASKR